MKKVVILRGISGSGKSTYAKELTNKLEDEKTVSICSVDSYFTDHKGKYNFDPKKLGSAHLECFTIFMSALRHEQNLVIVDNLNAQAHKMSPYIMMAGLHDYEVEVIRCLCPFTIASKRNIHNVPLETISQQLKRFEDIPSYWGKEKKVLTYQHK